MNSVKGNKSRTTIIPKLVKNPDSLIRPDSEPFELLHEKHIKN